jgi:cytochrome c peroxidase
LPAGDPASAENPSTPAKVALGRQLFFDARLSGNNRMSCATCHLPEKALADGLATARGWDDKPLARNTPGLLNIGLQSSFFWDGRARSLEEQALGPIQSPQEMHQSLDELEQELGAVAGYREQFQRVYQTQVTRDGLARSLAAFQRTLISRNSPLDRYLAGDKSALTAAAQEGLRLFTGDAGCVRCHNGPLLSDGRYYRMGVGFGDKGRGAVTGKDEDQYKFRTPSLRDVARTAPYMHDGSRKTLFDVVEFYYRTAPTQGPDGTALDIEPLLGQSFSEMDALVAFLESLSGELPDLSAPELP